MPDNSHIALTKQAFIEQITRAEPACLKKLLLFACAEVTI
jgi:hypothetical protein